jgi:acyl dehydratase
MTTPSGRAPGRFSAETLTSAGFPVISYDGLAIGEVLRSDDRLIRPADVETFAYAVEDHDPWFFGPGPFGGPIAHPTLLANQALFLRHTRYVVPAGLHTRMGFRFVQPIPLGVRARTTGRIVETYVRRDKPYMVTEFETAGEDGLVLVEGRFVQMLFSNDTVPPSGSGPKPEAAPPGTDPSISGALGRDGLRLEVGQRLGPLRRTVTQRQIDCYSGVKPHSIHTDEEWAGAKGFPTTIAQGMMSTGYVSTLMTAAVGEGFIAGGRIDTRFLRPVCCGDTVTVEGTVTGFSPAGPGRVRAEIEVAGHNQRGEQTLAGTASGLVDRHPT